jgi:hypothetical protein
MTKSHFGNEFFLVGGREKMRIVHVYVPMGNPSTKQIQGVPKHMLHF